MSFKLEEIEQYFNQKISFPRVVIRRNEIISNPEKTAKSMIRFMKANPPGGNYGKRGFTAYQETLILIYEAVKSINNLS